MLRSKNFTFFMLLFCNGVMGFHSFIVMGSFIYSTILLAQLNVAESEIPLNTNQASWIASIPNLVCPIGLLITGILTDKIGRRRAIQTTYIPIITSWWMFAFARSYNVILLARIITGYATDIFDVESRKNLLPAKMISRNTSFKIESTIAMVFVYTAEMSPTSYRPLFLSLIFMLSALTALFETALAVFYTWRTVAMIYGAMSVVVALAMFAVPEPPQWLRSMNRIEEAERAERWLGLEPDTSADVATSKEQSIATPRLDETTWAVYTSSYVWKPTVHMLTLYLSQQFSGIYVLTAYTSEVLRDSHVRRDFQVGTAYLSVGRVVGSFIFTLLSNVKRKTLAVVSGLGMFISLAAVLGYMCVYDDVLDPLYSDIPLAAFFVYTIFSYVAAVPLPWSISGELYPMAVKGKMNAISQSIGYEIMFGVTKLYPIMVSALGLKTVWSIYASVCLLYTLYGATLMPETQGKSLEEITAYFDPKKEKQQADIVNNSVA
ncbi:facilitated trehalose transporter Tret1-like isoform X2 [Adelges cooleyi]|nr:facilitated trehalose transporter Tret1-like isoform X2 [Adelges cooleyi]XP_050439280.1 facilitated trehalose transporter Tret1-like isoform X2 [Adelges cooleyi]XP_050439281.1 facilitated trehalose transporter Tret1-like isoform X2 [Adelges cooleyi]XP_050439282.1 facilitated trehalose transporter Tret1-like isoform X2 [Adelges cooleyi]